MADIKLKDLYGDEQSYSGVTELSVPKADGSGRTWYVELTATAFVLQNIGYVPPEGASIVATSTVGISAIAGNGGRIYFVLLSFPMQEGVNDYPVLVAITCSEPLGAADGSYIYVSETLTAEQLRQLGVVDEGATGTATQGWNAVEEQEDGTSTIAHIDEPERIITYIPLPITFSNDESRNAFYATFSEASAESTAVTLTENGMQTIVPDTGVSGLRSVAVTVEVPEAQMQEKAVTLTENGTVEIAPDEGYDGISTLSLTVEVEGGGGSVEGAVTAADVTAMLASAGVVEPTAVEDNKVLSDSNDDIYIF